MRIEAAPREDWRTAFILALFAAAMYLLLAWRSETLTAHSASNYYLQQAEAFNQGSLSLIGDGEFDHDLITYRGRRYLYWPPAPAIVLMPLVGLFGTEWSDAWLTIVAAGLNVGMAFLLIRSRWNGNALNLTSALFATAAFAFGSVHMTLAPLGAVWATGQLFGCLFLSVSLLLILSQSSPALLAVAGAFAGLACLSRLSIAGAVCAFLVLIILQDVDKRGFDRILRFAAFTATLGGFALFYFWYNHARFGNILDTGYAYHHFHERFAADIAAYGMFSTHYFGHNIFYHYLAYPFFPWVADPTEGASLFLMTPVYFAVFGTLFRRSPEVAAMWMGIVLAALPSLFLFGTGWAQIGPRYTLDYTPLLLVLIGIGLRAWPIVLVQAAAVASVLQYCYGLQFLPTAN